MVAGFIVLALSGVALGVAATGDSAVALIPGLLLQGAGLGIVLTVNDPVGMNAVDDADSGQAAGIINTAEQMGGAIGIAGLGAAQLGYYFHLLYSRLAARGINPTPAQSRDGEALHRPRPSSRDCTTSDSIRPSDTSCTTSSTATPSRSNSRSTSPPASPCSAR